MEQDASRISLVLTHLGRAAQESRQLDRAEAFVNEALALQHGFVDGGLSIRFPSIGRALAAAAIIASIEAAAVVACFAAFGRFLRIRR